MYLQFLRYRGIFAVLIFEAFLVAVFALTKDMEATIPRLPLGTGVVSIALSAFLGLPAVLALANYFRWELKPFEELSRRAFYLRFSLAVVLSQGFLMINLGITFGGEGVLALLGGYCYFLSLAAIGLHLGGKIFFWMLPITGAVLMSNAPARWLGSDLFFKSFGFFFADSRPEYPGALVLITALIVGTLFVRKPRVVP